MGKEFAAVLWDVDVENFDVERHAGFLVRRVLEWGTDEEWQILCERLGLARVESIAVGLPRLEPRAHAFCAEFFGRPPESFACFNAERSAPAPWISSSA